MTQDTDETVAWDLTLTAPGKADLRIPAEATRDGARLPTLPAERVDTASTKDENTSSGYTPPHVLHSVDPE